MLRAARLVAEQGTPVLGINLGQLGFLAMFSPAEAKQALAAALAGKLPRAERMRLAVTFIAGRRAPRAMTAATRCRSCATRSTMRCCTRARWRA